MKQLLLFALLYTISVTAFAQLQEKDFLSVHFGTESKGYAAEVNTVNGKNFTCRFLHSQSVYSFKDLQIRKLLPDGSPTPLAFTATVQKSVGGAYKPGTIAWLNIYRPDYSANMSFADLNALEPGSSVIAVKFDDGKSYVGKFNGIDDRNFMQIKFVHTESIYLFKQDGVIEKSGGMYKVGRKATFHTLKIISHEDIK